MVVWHHEGNKIELKLETNGLSLKTERLIGWKKEKNYLIYDPAVLGTLIGLWPFNNWISNAIPKRLKTALTVVEVKICL